MKITGTTALGDSAAREVAGEERVTKLFRRWEELDEAEIAELRRLHDALLESAKDRARGVPATTSSRPAAGE